MRSFLGRGAAGWLLGLVPCLVAPSLHAQQWIGPANGDWFTGAYWNSGVPPTAGTNASIFTAGPSVNAAGAVAQFIQVGGTDGATGFTVQGNGTLNVGQSISLASTDPNNRFVTYASLSVLGGGSVTTPELDLAASTNDTASLLVDGAGSRLSLTHTSGYTLVAGDDGGIANVTVSNGGTLTTGTTLYLSRQPTTLGTMTIASGGTVTINGNGVLSMGNSNNYGGSSTLNIGNGGAVGFLNASIIKTFTADGEHAQINFNHTNANYTFGVQITGPGSVAQIGSGTTILTNNNNTYTGGTTVKAGTLLASNNSTGSATGTGAVNVTGTGTILGGTGTISGAVTVAAGSLLQGGTGSNTGALTLNGGLTLSGGSVVELGLGSDGSHSSLKRGGGTWTLPSGLQFTFTGSPTPSKLYDNIFTGLTSNPGTESSWTVTNNGFTGSFVYDGAGGIDLTLTAVPEPATWLAGGLTVLLGVKGWQRRRRHALA